MNYDLYLFSCLELYDDNFRSQLYDVQYKRYLITFKI